MNKEIKKEIKSLAKQKKFDQIYEEYGPYHFRNYVSSEYKYNDAKRLANEGKYLEIYQKYGEAYQTIQKQEEESKKGFLARNKNLFKSMIISSVTSFLTSLFTVQAMTVLEPAIINDKLTKENAKKYEKEINEYEEGIEEYSQKFDTKTQSDMEIIMRTMKDMHETIKGYGTPEIDATGYLGLDIKENGIGVCRNMAPYIADQLNEINPEYNARVFALYMNANDLQENNIEHVSIDENQEIKTKGNIKEIYENQQLVKRMVDLDNSIFMQEYEDSKLCKTSLLKENQTDEVIFDENGNVEETRRTIREKQGEKEIEKIFVDEKLDTKREETNRYYKSTIYDERGRRSILTVADATSQRTTFYRDNGQVKFRTILEDGYETTIFYDEEENEIAREKEKTDNENIFSSIESIKRIDELEKKIEEIEDTLRKGNHVMVAVDIKSDNVTLLIDPTNLSLGIYKNGKMMMFNETELEDGIYDRNLEGEVVVKGTKGIKEYPIDYIKSFLEPKLSMEELEEKYGLEAQNKMLEQIKKEDNKKTFKDELKIDTEITYNVDTNVVTIDSSKRKNQNTKDR